MKPCVLLLAVALLSSCGLKKIEPAPAPDTVVLTQTIAQEQVQESLPIADAPKTDVPVGVEPKDVIAIVEQKQSDGEIEKTWIVQEPQPLVHIGKPKIRVYQNKTASHPAPSPTSPSGGEATSTPEPVIVHTMAPSHAWIWWVVVMAIIVALCWAARRYIPFVGTLFDGVDAAAKPIISEVAAEAGEASAHALKEAKSIRQRVFDSCRAIILRIFGGNA